MRTGARRVFAAEVSRRLLGLVALAIPVALGHHCAEPKQGDIHEGGGLARRILGPALVPLGGGGTAVPGEPLHAGEVGARGEGARDERPSKTVRCCVLVACLGATPSKAAHEVQRGDARARLHGARPRYGGRQGGGATPAHGQPLGGEGLLAARRKGEALPAALPRRAQGSGGGAHGLAAGALGEGGAGHGGRGMSGGGGLRRGGAECAFR